MRADENPRPERRTPPQMGGGRSLKTQQFGRQPGWISATETSVSTLFQASPKPRTARMPSTRRAPAAVGAAAFPRKEVIQPQLPLRLPCYDFTPIADPTFDGSLPYGLGHRLRVLPTLVV